MAEMQEGHNRQVHPDWRSQGYEYYRAIWVECAELLDHYGWKWWKHQEADLDQVKLEIVDIWHFALSDLLRAGTLTDEMAAGLVFEPDASRTDPAGFRAAVEALALATLAARSFVMAPFVDLLKALPMGFDELFRLYVGKNVLNGFRQDHGYRTGDYRKVWDGREDNEHLVELMASLETEPGRYPVTLYEALKARYPA
ncbi:MAG: dUTP diphosphatase [Alphaproteobacteria bacterium]|nr:MAG: dUTP diphosphatase [Alphaproteobacteria bacterium]